MIEEHHKDEARYCLEEWNQLWNEGQRPQFGDVVAKYIASAEERGRRGAVAECVRYVAGLAEYVRPIDAYWTAVKDTKAGVALSMRRKFLEDPDA